MDAASAPASLRDLLLTSFERHADRPAIWCGGETLRYAELAARALSLAAHIEERAHPEDPIGVASQKDVPSIVGVVAAALAGRAYVPLNPTFPEDRLKLIVGAARPKLVLATPETLEKTRSYAGGVPALVSDGATWRAEAGPIATGGAPAGAAAGPGAAAYYMFTSGTTGTPKGVRVNTSNLLAYLRNIDAVAAVTPEDRCSHFFDLSFDLSVHDLFVTLSAGAELVIAPTQASLDIVAFAAERRLTAWFSVPSVAAFCDRLGALTAGALPSLRLALFCGEALPTALARKFAAAAPNSRIFNLYGPTEATIAFTQFEVTPEVDLGAHPVVPLGWPLDGQRLDFAPLDSGSELLLGGSQVTPGYVNNAEQQAAKFFARDGVNWYRTGDEAAPDAVHGAVFRGRIDDQVKINGYRVELLEIDGVLREAAETPEVAAVVVEKSVGAAEVFAFVVGSARTGVEIRKACRAKLPNYMIPRKVHFLDDLPKNANGKIDRNALRKSLER